jgi:hypothetical protein
MRMRWIFFKTFLFGLVCLTVFVGSARANRRISLSQDLLIEDKDDVYLFPQLALDYRNLINFDLGGSAEEGRLLFLGGWDGLALGLAAHYSALTAPYNYLLANPIAGDLVSYETFALYRGAVSPVPFPVSTIGSLWAEAQPFSAIDGFIALPLGNGSIGARLGIATRANFEFFRRSADDKGTDETFVTMEAGLSGKGDIRYDASLNVSLDFGRVKNTSIPNPADPYGIFSTATEFADASGTLIRASLSGRSYFPFIKKIDIGVLGNAVFTNAALAKRETTETQEITENIMGVSVMGGLGPVYRIDENTTIGGYGLLGVAYSTQDPNDNIKTDTLSDLIFFLPAIRIAAEIGLTDWFFVRAGIQYSFQIASTSLGRYYQQQYDRGESLQHRDGSFSWSAGLGLKYESFTLDGALQNALLTSGPSFIGGSNPGLFIVISAAYHW